jgi:hypothetical protein
VILAVKTKKAVLAITGVVGGVLGFTLLMWTPETGSGIIAYAAFFVALAAIAIMLVPKHSGYWPGKPGDR